MLAYEAGVVTMASAWFLHWPVRGLYRVCLKTTRCRRTPQDAIERHKTLQNAHSYETPTYYGILHTLLYE